MRYNLSALEALEILYGGNINGVWKGDLIKNEKKRNLKLGLLQTEFLLKYGYFPVNKGEGSCLFVPDMIDQVSLEEPFYVVGRLRENEIFLSAATLAEDDPVIFMLHPEQPYLYLGNPEDLEENGCVDETLFCPNLVETNLRISEFLKILFCEKLHLMRESGLIEESDAIAKLLEGIQLDVTELMSKENVTDGRYISICYNEKNDVFFGVQMEKGNIAYILFYVPDEIVGAEKYASLSVADLEALVNKEFYQNSLKCDYAQVLEILQELTLRLEALEPEQEQRKDFLHYLAGYYQIAGRCCWQLKDFAGADVWYQKASETFEECKDSYYEDVISFYIGQGNYFFSRKMVEESKRAYEKAAEICEQYAPQDYYHRGRIYQVQGENRMTEGTPEEALMLYEKALEIYQSDPKGCKYDIARCQQLRGEARRQAKEQENT